MLQPFGVIFSLILVFFLNQNFCYADAPTIDQKVFSILTSNQLGLETKMDEKLTDTIISLFEKDQIKDTSKINIIFDFWASWCGPCKESIPMYIEFLKQQSKLKDTKFVFIFINEDDSIKDATDFLRSTTNNKKENEFTELLNFKNQNLKMISIFDQKQKIYKSIDFESIPYTLIYQITDFNKSKDFNWTGKVILQKSGFNSKSIPKIKNLIQ